MKTVEEIKEKIEVYKRKMANLPPDDESYISCQGIVTALEWVIREELYKGAENDGKK